MDELEEHERALLEQYSLVFEDIEPRAWEKYIGGGRTHEGLARIVRLAAVNKMMMSNGLKPLLFDDTNHSAGGEPALSVQKVTRRSVDAAIKKSAKVKCTKPEPQEGQRELAKDVIMLSEDEYESVRGDYGEICGLHVDRRTYDAVMKSVMKASKAKSSMWVKLGEEGYIKHSLRKRARLMCSH